MNMSTLFTLASSGFVSVIIWMIVMIIVFLSEVKKKKAKDEKKRQNAINNQNKSSKKQPKKKTPTPAFVNTSNENNITNAEPLSSTEKISATIIKEKTTIHDEKSESDSIISMTDDVEATKPKITIDSPDEARKAIIYHEILDPKF